MTRWRVAVMRSETRQMTASVLSALLPLSLFCFLPLPESVFCFSASIPAAHYRSGV